MSFSSPNSPNCKSVSSMPLANNYERCDINKNRFEMAIRLRASQQSSQPIKKHKSKSSITIQKLNKIIPVLPDFTKMISSIPRSYFSLSPSLNKRKYEVINIHEHPKNSDEVADVGFRPVSDIRPEVPEKLGSDVINFNIKLRINIEYINE